MDTLASITLDNSTTLGEQRGCFAPSNRELGLLLQGKYGLGLEDFEPTELGIARVVFAQVALMAGAALVADTETYVGAEQLWYDMQDKIGPRDRALATYFLELLSKDEYYSESERRLIGALGNSLLESETQRTRGLSDFGMQTPVLTIELPEPEQNALSDFAGIWVADEANDGDRADDEARARDSNVQIWMRLDESSTVLHAQRAGFVPSNRELGLLLGKEYGRELDDFAANDLVIARVVLSQVALMAGAALAADGETYLGAEQLWCELRDKIGSGDRMLAKHFLELLSRDEYYSISERGLIGSLAATLLETESLLPLRTRFDTASRIDPGTRFYLN